MRRPAGVRFKADGTLPLVLAAGHDYNSRTGDWLLYVEAAKHAHLIQKVTFDLPDHPDRPIFRTVSRAPYQLQGAGGISAGGTRTLTAVLSVYFLPYFRRPAHRITIEMTASNSVEQIAVTLTDPDVAKVRV